MKATIRIGDEVEYERANETITRVARVIEITREKHEGNTYTGVLTEERNFYEFTLDDQRWCYGFQIVCVNEWICTECNEVYDDEDSRNDCDCPGARAERLTALQDDEFDRKYTFTFKEDLPKRR